MTIKEIHLKLPDKKHIAVVGAGFFGIMGALKLAERGFNVTIFEKSPDVLMGASYINQNRLHMGYHYPRSDETAESSHVYQKAYARLFKETVVDDFYHYYCIAKTDSLTTAEDYIKFCERLGLPYSKEFPENITLNKDLISLVIRVPEKVYDSNLLRKTLKSIIEKDEGIELLLATEVTGIKRIQKGYEICFKGREGTTSRRYDAIVNAAYGNINRLIKMAGFETQEYQYELCEVLVVKVPWSVRTGCGIFDGPFFGVLPFGFSDEYLFYDVELSVLERSYGEFPNFKHDSAHYDSEAIRRERFKRYLNKAKKFIKEMENCKHLYSIYVTRIVLLNRDNDDARPTEVRDHGDGFWTIFSGKISAAIPAAERVAEGMYNYFNGNKTAS